MNTLSPHKLAPGWYVASHPRLFNGKQQIVFLDIEVTTLRVWAVCERYAFDTKEFTFYKRIQL